MGAFKKVQIAYFELYPLESGKAYGLVRLIDVAPVLRCVCTQELF